MKKANRYLAGYLNLKFNKSAIDVTETDIAGFLNENGWILYDLETIIKDFIAWRKKGINQRSQKLFY